MAKYKIDLTDVRTIYDMHERIQKDLNFPEYYGKNLDALWDCVTDMDAPVEISVYGAEKLGKEMKKVFVEITAVFSEAKIWFAENGDKFDYIIEETL